MTDSAPPPAAPRTTPRGPVNKVARIAFIVAVIAFVLGLIPFVGFVSWLIAAAAVVVAIVALARKGPPKGFAVAGLIIGLIALFVGPAVSIASVIGAVAAGSVSAAGGASPPAVAASDDAAESTAGTAPTDASSTPAAEPTTAEAQPAVKSKTFTGSGDKVVKVDLSDPVIMSFSCSACSGNTSVKTDSGTDTLPVNTIGGYSGRTLLNASDGALLTRIVIGADAKWKLTLKDPTEASLKRVSAGETLKGNGDDVVIVSDGVSDSDVRNEGQGNFAIKSYGGSDSLPVNEIGSYKGNVVLDGPAVIQVNSDGKWSIKGNG